MLLERTGFVGLLGRFVGFMGKFVGILRCSLVFTDEVQSQYPLSGGTVSRRLPLYLPYGANTACYFSFPVLQYPWRLRPFVSLGVVALF